MKYFKYFLLLSSYCLLLNAQGNYEFGPSIIVNDDSPGTSGHYISSSGQHGITCCADTVYVVWADERSGYTGLYFSGSTDAGQTWGTDLRLGGGNEDSTAGRASIKLDINNQIYVAFGTGIVATNDINICFVKSSDGGLSFSSHLQVNDTTWETQQNPSIAVDSSGQNVYVVWEDARNYGNSALADIYCARSIDGGASFLPSVRVDDTGSDSSRQRGPSVGCTQSGDTVYVAWGDNRNHSNYDIYFARSVDGGQSFEPNQRINDVEGSHQSCPSLFVSKSSAVYIGWQDRGQRAYRIYCDKSTDGGISFGQDMPVSDSGYTGIEPSIVVDDSERVFLTWQDSRNFNNTGYDIYFSFSTDSGKTFSSDVRVNDLEGIGNAWDTHANVTVNKQGTVYVGWRSDRNDPSGNYQDIYCAAGQFVGIQENMQNNNINELIRIMPNPFTTHCIMKLQISNSKIENKEDIVFKLYDVAGELIKVIIPSDRHPKSSRRMVWDGTDHAGCAVPMGVYFCLVEIGEVMCSKKLIKIKN